MGGNLNGRPFLIETRALTEEPAPLLRATTSRLLLINPAVHWGREIPDPENGAANNSGKESGPRRKWTQRDQDETDAELRRRIMKDLVQSWMDRLQLISVITTFFATMEAQLLVITTPDRGEKSPPIEQAANAGLAGALATHLFAAIVSFLSAFFLIRYRVREAKREEQKVETGITPPSTTSSELPVIFSSNPHLEQVGPFSKRQPPTHLLHHLHSLCMGLAAVGFVLALTGTLCYTWARLPRSVSTFATACMGVCGVTTVFTIVLAAYD
ncbi:hypothetical protein AcW1_003477 [Taiwanofungus camphoratus]|nr:hypothetical protein AcV5_002060 [Antrodia cinnamomea]KAI0941646.1 hypothetical protein AcW1_003477 [Antrodia cinnamomea]KAI0943863.1 hypothetical protein AcV7_001836 [Antrodia cinnamomea]